MSKFLSKNLSGISCYIKDSVYSEKYAAKRGLLQSIDNRVKLISILGFIIITVYLQSIAGMLVLMGFALFFASMSGISLRFYITRVWLFVPVFTGIIAIPAVFNLVTPGREIIRLISLNGFTLSITYEGLRSATILVLRVATAVSFAVLLSLTTKWNELMNSLLSIRISSVFVLVLTFTYRYIFYLLDIMSKMLLSRKARSSGQLSARENWRLYAPLIGALFIRTYETNEKVYLAMLSRGFTGEIKEKNAFRAGAMSIIFFATVTVIYVILLYADHIRVIT